MGRKWEEYVRLARSISHNKKPQGRFGILEGTSGTRKNEIKQKGAEVLFPVIDGA